MKPNQNPPKRATKDMDNTDLDQIRQRLTKAKISLDSYTEKPAKTPASGIAAASLEIIADVPELPPVCYDPDKKDYLIPESRSQYIRVSRGVAEDFLSSIGIRNDREEGEAESEMDRVMRRIHAEHSVDYFGPLAGHKAGLKIWGNYRILVKSSPCLVTPSPGNWSILRQFIQGLFGSEQLPYVYGWLKFALETYHSGTCRPGQAFIMCGPPGAGKNLLRWLIAIMFGGEERVAYPFQYMTKATSFNSDCFSAETLAIEDEAASRDIRIRVTFGMQIKQITANRDQRYHRKYGEPITLRPVWRLIISLNDDGEAILVLPPITPGLADKLMLLKVEKQPLPPEGTTMDEFTAKLREELPAFVNFLPHEHQIPEDLRSTRFGIIHYHHPALLDELADTEPEEILRGMIDEVIFSAPTQKDWDGSAAALERILTQKDGICARESQRLLPHPSTCGVLLGRLQVKYPEYVTGRRLVRGRTVWTIKAPAKPEADDPQNFIDRHGMPVQSEGMVGIERLLLRLKALPKQP